MSPVSCANAEHGRADGPYTRCALAADSDDDASEHGDFDARWYAMTIHKPKGRRTCEYDFYFDGQVMVPSTQIRRQRRKRAS